MAPEHYPTLIEICKVLREKRGILFESICNDYLKARYPNLKLTPWVSTRAEWTRSGPHDAFGIDEYGRLISCQYGPKEIGWQTKLLGDAEKVKELAEKHGIEVSLLIFCTIAELDGPTIIKAQQEVRNLYGFPTEIVGLHRLASELSMDYPGIAYRRLGITIRLKYFDSLDTYLDSPNPRYWPKCQDVKEGKLYYPEDYFREIEKKLFEGRCLLTGKSGSGKTALAIAFALWWRNNNNEEFWRKHPESIGFYLDAKDCDEKEGADWYREILEYDCQNELFLIDNCHLAAAAVNFFCSQWNRRRPQKAKVLLLSAPRGADSVYEDDYEDYFNSFEETDVVVEVHPEEIWEGVVQTCSKVYQNLDQARFVPADQDLNDPGRRAALERLCSRNLVSARCQLEAWGEKGGRLSDISEEAALEGLAHRHLTGSKAQVLPVLCSLGQFDIPAHMDFVNNLPNEGVSKLREENLLTPVNSPYGICYHLAFHPQEAALIFRAQVMRRLGTSYEAYIEEELFDFLKNYLVSKPNNFIAVYDNIYRCREVELEHRLIRDIELQTITLNQLYKRPLVENACYIYYLFKVNPERASSLLDNIIHKTTPKIFKEKILSLNSSEFWLVSVFLSKVNLDLARKVLDNLPPYWVAERLASQRAGTINRWISLRKNTLSVELGYSKNWIEKVAYLTDLTHLVELVITWVRAPKSSLQSFLWLRNNLKIIAPEKEKQFLTQITHKLINEINAHPEVVNIKVIKQLKVILGQKYRNILLQSLDDDVLIEMFNQSTLAQIREALLCHTSLLRNKYKDFAAKYLRERLDNEGIKEINEFIECFHQIPVDGQQLGAEALNLLLKIDLTERVAGEDVKQLALLLFNAYSIDPDFPGRLLTALNSGNVVERALKDSSIGGIQLLLHNLSYIMPDYIPTVGKYLQILDLRDRIGNTDISDLSYFLWNVRAHLGEDLAQSYCRLVDAHSFPQLADKADLKELMSLFWNMVHISDLDELQLLHGPMLALRLSREWKTHPGLCASILGVLVTIRPNSINNYNLSLPNAKQSEKLTQWLSEQIQQSHPYAFALALRGLRALNESILGKILNNVFYDKTDTDNGLELLQNAMGRAITPRSKALLGDIIGFVKRWVSG